VRDAPSEAYYGTPQRVRKRDNAQMGPFQQPAKRFTAMHRRPATLHEGPGNST